MSFWGRVRSEWLPLWKLSGEKKLAVPSTHKQNLINHYLINNLKNPWLMSSIVSLVLTDLPFLSSQVMEKKTIMVRSKDRISAVNELLWKATAGAERWQPSTRAQPSCHLKPCNPSALLSPADVSQSHLRRKMRCFDVEFDMSYWSSCSLLLIFLNVSRCCQQREKSISEARNQ